MEDRARHGRRMAARETTYLVFNCTGVPQHTAIPRAKYAPYRDRVPPGPLLLLRPQRVLWWRAG